jgi:hypothetical protein
MNTTKVPSHSYLPTADGARQHQLEVNEYVKSINTERELLLACRELINEYYQGGGDACLASALIDKIGKLK